MSVLAPPACPWCGAAYDARARTQGAHRLRCDACGVEATVPWPTDAELDRAYGGHYRPGSGRFAGPGDRLLRRSRGRLAQRLDRIAPPGPVLDVGAGDGALVDAVRATGRDAVGLERGDGELADAGGPWAAIVLWHSLEHLRAPGETLDVAGAMLAPGGVIAVAAPNAESLQAKAFGDAWLALDIPRHLTHAPAGALVARLRRGGLTVERVSHWRGGQGVFGWLHGLVGSLPGRPHLYDAIRRPDARSAPMSGGRRAATLVAAAVLTPVAAACAALEVLARRGGSVYVEARR